MNYSCQDAAEALAAHALDALPAGERLLLLEHLAECRDHDEELARDREVAGRLSLSLRPTAPPGRLRAALLEAFDREAALLQPQVAPAAQEPDALPAPASTDAVAAEPARQGSVLALLRQPALAYGIAAALLIAVVGLAAWNLSLQDDARVLTTSAAGPGMSLRVSYYSNQQVAIFDLDMPPPAAGHVYQAWMISEGKPVSLGVLPSNHGRIAFAGDMSHAEAVAISLEPMGGSSQPTTPIVEAKF